MNEKPLKLGAAYHGCRMPHHAYEDLKSMAVNGLDIVVHMFSHTDFERHREVMKDIVNMSGELGLEVWVDNWGLGGPPGDKSHFLAYYPDSHMYLSDGSMDPSRACLNSPDFRRFTKEWIDGVEYIGGKTIFWDEPHMPENEEQGKKYYGCTCKRCRQLFREKYGYEMPMEADGNTKEFAADTVADYLDEMTAYAAGKGIKNTVCVMLGTYGMSLQSVDKLCTLPHLDSVGSDPYWVGEKYKDPSFSVYKYVYEGTKENLRVSNKFNKDHNIWIQSFANPAGQEEDIVLAAEAAYDAGARTILSWSYMAGESNDYHSENPPVSWAKTLDAMRRVREMERGRILEEERQKIKACYK